MADVIITKYKEKTVDNDYLTIGLWNFDDTPYAEVGDAGVGLVPDLALNDQWRALTDAILAIHDGIAFEEAATVPDSLAVVDKPGLWYKSTDDTLHLRLTDGTDKIITQGLTAAEVAELQPWLDDIVLADGGGITTPTNTGGIGFGVATLGGFIGTYTAPVDRLLINSQNGYDLDLESDNDLDLIAASDIYMQDQWLVSPITLAQSGETELDLWFDDNSADSIVGCLNLLSRNKYPAGFLSRVITYYEFMRGDYDGWDTSVSANGAVNSGVQVDGLFGVCSVGINNGASAADYARISREAVGKGEVKLGQGSYGPYFVTKTEANLPSSPSNDYQVLVGLTDVLNDFGQLVGGGTPNAGAITDGVFFWFDATYTNWQCATVSGGTITNTDSGVAVTANTKFNVHFVVNAAGTSIVFNIDGVTITTHTTNIPSAYIGQHVGVRANGNFNANRVFYLDASQERYELTTERG